MNNYNYNKQHPKNTFADLPDNTKQVVRNYHLKEYGEAEDNVFQTLSEEAPDIWRDMYGQAINDNLAKLKIK